MSGTLILLVTLAWAETPLPSYEDAVTRAAWTEVDALIERGKYAEAISRAEDFERTVTENAGLAHLIGLSYTYLDHPRKAERHLQRATGLDAEYAAPWHDLGELYLVQGRFDEARDCYERVSELVPAGPGSAVGPRRLAEVAAHQGRPEAFEEHIREALRRGFSFREIAGLPNWQKFYADPVMQDSVEKMITVYGDRKVLESLVPPQSATASTSE